jgi:hypothetical protein
MVDGIDREELLALLADPEFQHELTKRRILRSLGPSLTSTWRTADG